MRSDLLCQVSLGSFVNVPSPLSSSPSGRSGSPPTSWPTLPRQHFRSSSCSITSSSGSPFGIPGSRPLVVDGTAGGPFSQIVNSSPVSRGSAGGFCQRQALPSAAVFHRVVRTGLPFSSRVVPWRVMVPIAASRAMRRSIRKRWLAVIRSRLSVKTWLHPRVCARARHWPWHFAGMILISLGRFLPRSRRSSEAGARCAGPHRQNRPARQDSWITPATSSKTATRAA